MKNTARTGIVLSLLSAGLAGCDDGRSFSAPSAPSSVSPPSPPSPQPTALQPIVTSITPNTSSTRGDAWGTITGTQFQPGATVTLGSAGAAWANVHNGRTIVFGTNASAVGRIDVTVTNPNGLSSTLTGGYTFAPPETFDFNGDWVAGNGVEVALEMYFTIRDNMLVRVSCDGAVLTLPSGSPVHNGEFFFLGDDGTAVSGRILSPVNALGTVNLGPCTNARWWADKSGVVRRITP